MTEAHLSLGNVATTMGDTALAVDLLHSCCRAGPALCGGAQCAGQCAACGDRLREAEESYRQAVELDPAFADAHYNLGNLYRYRSNMRRRRSATSGRLRSLLNTRRRTTIWASPARTSGETEQAVAAFERALALHPAYAEAHFNLGTVRLAKAAQHAEAVRAFDAAHRDPAGVCARLP